jgi:hypothetical protein
VVFDCNIFLDAASLVGPPFSWQKFDAAVARISRDPVPHPDDQSYDSLRAMAACTSGRFAGEELIEVWTSSHIDKVVRGKANQSIQPDPMTGYQGLGWTVEAAQGLVNDLIYGLVERSDGGTVLAFVPIRILTWPQPCPNTVNVRRSGPSSTYAVLGPTHTESRTQTTAIGLALGACKRVSTARR